eukprot:TRINITY_DN906_c1_g1_i1.p1 TRINITY_DN906_c1_g1~~TRINITY_DN906_c1_g1_i1.p1  ORF type:complete len:181 (-),score=6.51 TRINITY_DN906_c1_g1_i1:192-734(-)
MPASRLSDVNRLEKEYVFLKEGPAVQINVQRQVMKTDIFNLRTIQLVSVDIQTECSQETPIVDKRQSVTFPEASDSRLSTMLKKLDSRLTPHSIKRGAIKALWESTISIQSSEHRVTLPWRRYFRYLQRSATKDQRRQNRSVARTGPLLNALFPSVHPPVPLSSDHFYAQSEIGVAGSAF